MKTPIFTAKAAHTEHDPALLTVQQAQAHILDSIIPVTEHDTLPIREALQRILAETIYSPINVPPYDNSAMDGYAVRSTDLPASGMTSLNLIGTSWAGRPYNGSVGAQECVRIMTGAKIPKGADTIIMQEHVQLTNDSIVISAGHQCGQHVRHAGDDIQQGSNVLAVGKKIGAAEVGLLASLGISHIKVARRVRVAFFSTGDELRSVGEPLADGQIYDSNRYTLFGMLQQAGVDFTDMGVVRDQPEAIEQALITAAKHAEVILTSGGVSVGDADFVKDALDKLGKVNFWRIAMKPGKPLAVGKIGNAAFFGLPGNPVSVMSTFYQFVLPALRKMSGQANHTPLVVRAISKSRIKKSPGRTDFQRGILFSENGTLHVDATGMQASHILSGMSRANCFIILAQHAGDVEAGSEVEVQPFADFWS